VLGFLRMPDKAPCGGGGLVYSGDVAGEQSVSHVLNGCLPRLFQREKTTSENGKIFN
jgi:hypothetical protein